MALRFYLCDVVGTGRGQDPFRPRLVQLAEQAGVNLTWSADDGRLNSEQTQATGWMLVWTDLTDAQHARVVQDGGVRWIPFEDTKGRPVGPDQPIGDVAPARRSQIRARLEAHHVPTDDLTLSDPVRTVVSRIVRRIRTRRALGDQDWREGMDALVSELQPARRQAISQRLQARGYDTSVVQATDTVREALQKLQAQDVPANRNGWD